MATVTRSGPITRLTITHKHATASVDSTEFRLLISESQPSPFEIALLAALKDAFLAGRSIKVTGETPPPKVPQELLNLLSVELSP